MKNTVISVEIIENKIFVIRDHKVMIDRDLAELYGVQTKVLNQAVSRNKDRFPENFMFQLTDAEWILLRSQIVTSTESKGGRRYNPYVFTEYGVLMLSNILNSKKAVAVSIQIVNAFIKLREMALANNDLAKQLNEIEQRFIQYSRDTNLEIEEIFTQLDYLKDITKPSEIGFRTK
ncbi:MAG: ORF6N domain-containing protein [Candidatus Gastranaerophilales bacterium]|nr:ORF6N domain-containing protein [Candidatus Gastranaerophilales bacterium]